MKIAAAYIRVSTEEQTELSPDSQIKQIREYAKRNDYIVPDEFIFHDDGISGRTTAKRPGFNKMIGIAKLKPKPFDAILLWKFSRFARNREDSIVYKSMLRKLGIDVISISENIGDDKMSVLIEAMIEAMDEYYSINLAEEVKRGMLEKLSRGQIVNGPPMGYALKNDNFVPDENAALILRIFNDFVSGLGLATIARQLNYEGHRTVRGNFFENRTVEYILRNPVYIGKLRWTPGGSAARNRCFTDSSDVIIVDGHHEPIISMELWNQAQELLDKQKRKYTRYARENPTANDFMLRGLVRCSNCGSTLVLNRVANGLQCHRYAKGQCNESHFISLPKINESVIHALQKSIDDFNLNVEYRAARKVEMPDNIEQLIKREKEKLVRVKEAYSAGVDTLEEYKSNKQKILQKISELESRINKALPVPNRTEMINMLHTKIQDFVNLTKDPTISQNSLNNALKEFVSKIVFRRSDNKIEMFFYL